MSRGFGVCFSVMSEVDWGAGVGSSIFVCYFRVFFRRYCYFGLDDRLMARLFVVGIVELRKCNSNTVVVLLMELKMSECRSLTFEPHWYQEVYQEHFTTHKQHVHHQKFIPHST